MNKIKTFDEKFFDFIRNYIERNLFYFKINICVYTCDYKISRIYTLTYEEIFDKMHIFNLKNQNMSYAICKETFSDAIGDVCEIIKKDFGNDFGYGNPYDLVKIGNLFS